MKTLLLLVFFAFVSSAQAVVPGLDEHCRNSRDIKTKTPVYEPLNFCVYTWPGSKNPDILYYFHGGGGSAKQWGQMKEYYSLWKKLGIDPPTVVTYSLGPFWLMKGSKSEQGTRMHWFLKEFIPAVENLVGFDQKKGFRHLEGVSMGAANAFLVSLNGPALFEKVALNCPAILLWAQH